MKKKTFQRELPSSECNTFLSTLHFRKMENGKKTIKLDRQVDQKKKKTKNFNKEHGSRRLVDKCDVFRLPRQIQFYRCHVSNAMAH